MYDLFPFIHDQRNNNSIFEIVRKSNILDLCKQNGEKT